MTTCHFPIDGIDEEIPTGAMAKGNRQILNLIMFETTNDCTPSDEFD